MGPASAHLSGPQFLHLYYGDSKPCPAASSSAKDPRGIMFGRMGLGGWGWPLFFGKDTVPLQEIWGHDNLVHLPS